MEKSVYDGYKTRWRNIFIAQLRGVRPRNLEQSTSFATHPRTVAEHLQLSFSSIREPSSSTVVTDQRVRRRKYSASTQLDSQCGRGQPSFDLKWFCVSRNLSVEKYARACIDTAIDV